jgi:hypothetical protein
MKIIIPFTNQTSTDKELIKTLIESNMIHVVK